MHRTASHNKDAVAPNVKSAEFDSLLWGIHALCFWPGPPGALPNLLFLLLGLAVIETLLPFDQKRIPSCLLLS